MKLSLAIRLGAMLGKQRFDDVDSLPDEGCAWLWAVRAAGLWEQRRLSFDLFKDRILDAFPIVKQARDCPLCRRVWSGKAASVIPLVDTIAHLNDDHRWTLEAIADQVEMWETELERELEAAQEPVATLTNTVG